MTDLATFDRDAMRAWRQDQEDGIERVIKKYGRGGPVAHYKLLRRFLSKHPKLRLFPNCLLFNLVVDPWLESVDLVAKEEDRKVVFLLAVLDAYLEFDQSVYPLCPHAQPESDGDEEEARWKKIETIFKKLGKGSRIYVFKKMLDKSASLRRDDHWILRDLGVYLPLGRRMRVLATIACGEGGADKCGNHSDLGVFRALHREATLEVKAGKPTEDPRAQETRKRYFAQPL